MKFATTDEIAPAGMRAPTRHDRVGEDVVHMRLTRSELATLRTVLEIACDDPFGELTDRIDALAARVRDLQGALG